MIGIAPPQAEQVSMSIPNTRFRRCAQVISAAGGVVDRRVHESGVEPVVEPGHQFPDQRAQLLGVQRVEGLVGLRQVTRCVGHQARLAWNTHAGSITKPELNWRRKADEVERSFRVPITAKNPLDRLRPIAVPAGFSIRFALVRSNPQRFDCVLSIVGVRGAAPLVPPGI
jgi:hypothetical protein